MTDQQLLERIVLNPKILAGKPVIRGTHLSVEYILNLHSEWCKFYDPNGGLRVFNLFSRLPSDYTENSSHPPTQQRINALNQAMNKYLWFPLWIDGNERLKNNPQPLKLDLSEDGVSLRINSRFISR